MIDDRVLCDGDEFWIKSVIWSPELKLHEAAVCTESVGPIESCVMYCNDVYLRLTDQDECSTSPCRGAPCVDGILLYLCECPATRTGSICERSNYQRAVTLSCVRKTAVGLRHCCHT